MAIALTWLVSMAWAAPPTEPVGESDPSAPPDFSLRPAKASFVIGEPIWLILHADNHTSEVLHGQISTSPGRPPDDMPVSVTGPAGEQVPSPERGSTAGWTSGWMTALDVPPGYAGELKVDLAQAAWMDVPGTYDVRVRAPFEDRALDAAGPRDVRWTSTQVVLVAPTNQRAVVLSQPPTIDIARAAELSSRGSLFRTHVSSYEALGHVAYVEVLESMARQRRAAAGTPDERAILGLSACPCLEATEALVRLFDHFDSGTEDRKIVATELITRIPVPRLEPNWFVTQAWHPRFQPLVLERARTALAGPVDVPGWSEAYAWGATVVDRLGDMSDGLLVAEAFARTLNTYPESGPDGASSYGEATSSLERALKHFPAPPGEVSGTVAMLVELQSWDRRGDAPPGWEEVVLRGLASDDPLVVATAMAKAPAREPTDALISAMLAHVGPDNPRATNAFDQYGGQVRPDARVLVEPIRRELRAAHRTRVPALLEVLGGLWCGTRGEERTWCVPKDEWLELVLAAIAADASNHALLDLPRDVLDGCRSGHGGPAETADIPVMVAAWTRTLERERARLHEGLLPIVPGETDPNLMPTYTCTLESGEEWPQR